MAAGPKGRKAEKRVRQRAQISARKSCGRALEQWAAGRLDVAASLLGPLSCQPMAQALLGMIGRLRGDAKGQAPQPAALRELAALCLEIDFLDGAADLLAACAEADPQDAEARNDLGVVRQRQGRLEEAERCLRLALELAPGSPDALFNLAGLLAAAGRHAEAEGLLRRVPEGSLAAAGCNLMAEVLLAQGKRAEAAEALKRSLALSPAQPEVTGLLSQLGIASQAPLPRRIAFFCKKGLDSFIKGAVAHFRALGCQAELHYSDTLSDAELGRLMAQADLSWFEWCDDVLVRASRLPEAARTRLVCRLHHYEAFSGLARQVNWKAVSDLVFVSAHIRDLTAEQVPGLSDLCRLHVVPNGVDTERLGFRERERGFEVAYLGYVNFKKGPMLLVQAARAICRLDPRYRLHIGGSFQDAFHALYFKQMMEEFGLTKRVVLHGWIEDVDAWLGDKHYVLCTSLSEGHPVGILEAMAKGLKPLIHNFYGASRVFPRELLWSDLEELAERLAGPYEPERYRDYIAQNFDTRRQMARFEAIARGQAEADALGTPPPLPASRTAQAAAAPKPQHEPRHAAPEAPPHAAPRSQAAPPAQPKAESMNFYHALPREMKVTTNRKTFVADYCRGKRVLHVGCVDAGLIRQRMSQGSFLHAMLMETAARVWGVDCDAEGIDYLKSLGVPDLFCLNAEELGGLTLDERPDIIVASEVLEHMANPGSFLETAGRFGCELLVSVPNAFSYRCICELSGGREFVHQDHNCYFSYTTLKTLVSKAGYSLLEPVAYYWPLDDEIGRKHTPLMATNPYFADGFIFILSPQERPSLRPVPVVEQMGQAAG